MAFEYIQGLLGKFKRPKFRYSLEFKNLLNEFGLSDREEIIFHAMNYANGSQLEGDYLEFGTYQGTQFTAAYHFAQNFDNLNKMRFYAFDSFEGLPEIVGVDAEKPVFVEGTYRCSLDDFKNNLINAEIDLTKIELIKGFYNKTLNDTTKASLKLTKAAIINVDCDLYSSTVPVLDFIVSCLQPGTVMLFDDYYCFGGDPNKGEQRAITEWLQNNSQIKIVPFIKYSTFGMSFIVVQC